MRVIRNTAGAGAADQAVLAPVFCVLGAKMRITFYSSPLSNELGKSDPLLDSNQYFDTCPYKVTGHTLSFV